MELPEIVFELDGRTDHLVEDQLSALRRNGLCAVARLDGAVGLGAGAALGRHERADLEFPDRDAAQLFAGGHPGGFEVDARRARPSPAMYLSSVATMRARAS